MMHICVLSLRFFGYLLQFPKKIKVTKTERFMNLDFEIYSKLISLTNNLFRLPTERPTNQTKQQYQLS